ncbi:hypothetical protein MTO96_010190 [Rhipicephalus appendiculatus]
MRRAQTKTAIFNSANSVGNTLEIWKSCFSTRSRTHGTCRSGVIIVAPPSCARGDLAEHESTHVHKNRFCCALCSKIFVNGSVLRDHTMAHQGHPGYRCHLCPMVYATRPQLIKHLDSHKKAFACKVCNLSFVSNEALAAHVATHDKFQRRRPLRHKCLHCPRTFYHRGHLADHERTHTGERPFTCDMCEKKFTRHSHLLAHKRMQHAK